MSRPGGGTRGCAVRRMRAILGLVALLRDAPVNNMNHILQAPAKGAHRGPVVAAFFNFLLPGVNTSLSHATNPKLCTHIKMDRCIRFVADASQVRPTPGFDNIIPSLKKNPPHHGDHPDR
jgi:hypothetical protein